MSDFRGKIQRASSGEYVQGENHGDILQWDADAEEWFSAVLPSSISAPLSTVRYVDPDTEVEPSDQNGSEAAPFDTVQAAIDSCTQAGAAYCIYICAGLDSSPGPIEIPAGGFSFTFEGMGPGFSNGAPNDSMVSVGAMTALDTSAAVTCRNLKISSITLDISDTAGLVLQNCVVQGAITMQTNDLVFATETFFNDDIVGANLVTTGTCFFGSGVVLSETALINAQSYKNASNASVSFAGTPQRTWLEGSSGILNESGVAGETISNALDELNP